MLRAATFLVLLATCISPACRAQDEDNLPSKIQPNWEHDLQQRHDALVKANGPGTDAALRSQLLAMTAKDQAARGFENGEPTDKDKLVMAKNLDQIDAELTRQLQVIVAKYGWPTIALVGIDASNGAMLMLTHSHDQSWRRSMLPRLEKLANAGRIDGSALALTVDMELVSDGKPQRYGNRFKMEDGVMKMYAVEDPAGLNARRARMFLMPMDAYEQGMEMIYHVKLSDQIAEPEKPTP